VIAIYNLPDRRGNQRFVGLSNLFFHAHIKGEEIKIPIDEIAKVVLEKRKKLAPLIAGGIITSLGLLSMFLYSSGLEVVGLVAGGLLLTYYGWQEYLVLHIEHTSNTKLIWLPQKVLLSSIRPLIAMLEYYISKQHFPYLAIFGSNSGQTLTHFESHPVLTSSPLQVTFSNKQIIDNQLLIVNPALLDAPIEIYTEGKLIGKSNYLINNDAVINNSATSTY